MSNPFVVGVYVPEEYFCNRSKETEVPEYCILKARSCPSFVNFQRFPTLDAKKLVNAPKMSAHHRGICHF